MSKPYACIDSFMQDNEFEFQKYLQVCAQCINDRVQDLTAYPTNRVENAMRYSILNGGKRIRGALLIKTAEMFGVSIEHSMQAAIAVECMHAYSLVHDDLPDMDDSKLRRGKPACHVKFDTVTAILAGDALQTMAFEMLSAPAWPVDADVKVTLISLLAQAVGAKGMVAGQMLDMRHTDQTTLADIKNLQDLKTGQLFMFCCTAGGHLGGVTQQQQHALHTYAHCLGLVFQIADDLLDLSGSSSETGKPTKQDTQKATFVDLLGENQARSYAHELIEEGLDSIRQFGHKSAFLEGALRFSLSRRC